MTTTTLTKNARTLVAAGTANPVTPTPAGVMLWSA